MKTLQPIAGITVSLLNDGSVSYTAPAMIDVDGIGPTHGDPDEQPDTSLHWSGKPLNADVDLFVVVPPQIIRGVGPVVLGSQAYVSNTLNGRSSDAVVGDVGPHDKIGEISRALAIVLGINPDPVSGGQDRHVIFYVIKPGVPAVVNGKQYQLQSD